MENEQTIDEFLRERLLINENGEAFSSFDEIVSFIEMYNNDIKLKYEIGKTNK